MEAVDIASNGALRINLYVRKSRGQERTPPEFEGL